MDLLRSKGDLELGADLGVAFRFKVSSLLLLSRLDVDRVERVDREDSVLDESVFVCLEQSLLAAVNGVCGPPLLAGLPQTPNSSALKLGMPNRSIDLLRTIDLDPKAAMAETGARRVPSRLDDGFLCNEGVKATSDAVIIAA